MVVPIAVEVLLNHAIRKGVLLRVRAGVQTSHVIQGHSVHTKIKLNITGGIVMGSTEVRGRQRVITTYR
jgi:hypothetical protein